MANRGILISGFLLWTALSWSQLSLAAPIEPLQVVPPAYRQIAYEENVPAESLYSLALTESSKRLPAGVRPWPWTLNVAGKGYRYATREQAWQALLQFVRRVPLKHIDVGIAQVNLGWNGQLFPSFYAAFEPYTNLHVAARILRSCYEANSGSWIQAAGCYHHPAGGQAAAIYIAIVRRNLATLSSESGTLTRQTQRSGAVMLASNQLTWIEPK